MKKKLTTKSLDALKPPMGKRYEVRDTEVPGLLIRVSAKGGKVWSVVKRIDGRARRISIGEYPVISLSEARQQARSILNDIALGKYENSGSDSPQLPTSTLSEVIDQFIERHAKPNNRDWKGSQGILKKFAVLNDRPIDQITRRDVLRVIDDMIDNGTPIRSNRALAAIKKLMNWCVDRGIIETSPIASLKPQAPEVQRDRVLTPGELTSIWNSAEDEGFPFAQFVQILILTGQRRGEVAGMRCSEIDFGSASWTLPKSRTKNGLSHTVPLSPVAMDILGTVLRFQGSDFVFTTTGRTPISGFGRLKKRLEVAVGLDVEEWRLHDIRRTVATNMAMVGIQPHIIEAVLNHKSGIVSGVAAVYNRHSYVDEKRDALEQWSERVEELINSNAAEATAKTAHPKATYQSSTSGDYSSESALR